VRDLSVRVIHPQDTQVGQILEVGLVGNRVEEKRGGGCVGNQNFEFVESRRKLVALTQDMVVVSDSASATAGTIDGYPDIIDETLPGSECFIGWEVFIVTS
jgi:hypothetical protein